MIAVSDIYRDKHVLITGGAGFIGSNLARCLSGLNAHVTIVDSLIPEYGGNVFNLNGYEERVVLNIADVRDQYSMNYLVQGKDYLFNLAGQISHTDSMQDPYTDLEINVRAQLSVLEACRKYNPKIQIFLASTRQIYGKQVQLPVNESHSLNPVDVNGINKIASEHYHLLYHRVYGIPITILRLTNIYGPRMRIKDARQTFIGWWINQIIQGKTIRVFGDGQQLRDFNYIDDVVEAILLITSKAEAVGNFYNLGAEPISLLELARLLVELTGKGSFETVPFPPERKMIDIGSYYGDFSKIQNRFGWYPVTPLREGLQRTLHYYQENLLRYL